MELSEAIREGAKRWKNSFLFAEVDDSRSLVPDGGCCALGAAMRMATGNDEWLRTAGEDEAFNSIIETTFPVCAMRVQCPHHKTYHPLRVVVSCLHLGAHWSREAIAEWVTVAEKDMTMHAELDHREAEERAARMRSGADQCS